MRMLALSLLLCFVSVDVSAREVKQKFLDIQEVKSESGLTAWLVEDHSVPVIAIKFAFRDIGAKNDPVDKQGLARMVSNTMDEGAGDMDSQAFQKSLEDHSITLRFGVTRDHFTGQLKTLSMHKEKAFDLLALALSEPRFDEEPVNRMRESNKSRIRSSVSNPRWIAARLQNDRIFEGHPYALNSGGTLSSLDAITPEDLHGFHKQLGKNNLMIAVAGDIDAETLKNVLDYLFGRLPEVYHEAPTQHTLKNAGKTYVYEQDIPQTVIMMSQAGVDRSSPDYYAAKVMNFILGESGFGSRLMEEIREKRGLTYGIYSYFSDYEETDVLNVSTSTRNETAAEMLDLIKAEWRKMLDEKVSDEELNSAKSYITGSLPLEFTSTDSIADILLNMQVDRLPIDYLDQRNALIHAVTADDVQQAAQKLLNSESLTTILVGKPEGVSDAVSLTTLPNVQ